MRVNDQPFLVPSSNILDAENIRVPVTVPVEGLDAHRTIAVETLVIPMLNVQIGLDGSQSFPSDTDSHLHL